MKRVPSFEVSVVIPIYNRREWVAPLLKMLAQQKFSAFEVVIVDDGSTDDTPAEILQTPAPFKVRCIQLDRNRGAAFARNAGFDAAQGKYVALLDSDDAWHPDKLQKQYEQFELAGDAELLVGLTRQIVVGGESFVTPKLPIKSESRVGEYLFQQGGVVQSSMMFLRTELAKKARFFEGDPCHQDWSFALRLEKLGAHFEMLPDPLVLYRDDSRPDRLSRRKMQVSLSWLDRNRVELGEPAYVAARASFASHMRREAMLPSLLMIGTGLFRGAVQLWRTLYYFFVWAFPSARKIGFYYKRWGQSEAALKRSPESKS